MKIRSGIKKRHSLEVKERQEQKAGLFMSDSPSNSLVQLIIGPVLNTKGGKYVTIM
jgi:hypothetical protein